MISLIKSIEAHKDKAWGVDTHETLPLLATASTDKTSNIYKLSEQGNFPLISKLDESHKRSVRTVAFKPPLGGEDNPVTDFIDLPALSSGSFDSTIAIWGIDEPEEGFDEDDEGDEQANHDKQVQLLVNPSNEWNLMAILEGHENEIKSVAWNYQGNLLASCSRDKTIWIWETDPETLEEFECISVLSDHDQDIKHVTWHPTQNLLASSSYDDTIRLYKQDENDDDWSCVGILNGHEGTVWSSCFENPKALSAKPTEMRLVSGSDDLTVKIWKCKVDKMTEDEAEKYQSLPSSIKYKSKEMEWELQTELPKVHEYPVYSVAWSKLSGRIASTGSDGKIVIYKQNHDNIWEVESIRSLCHGVTEINCITWGNLEDNREILITAGDDGRINIWNP